MIFNTDVLVIGGGSAGLHAAIEAKKYGLNVVLVYKTGGNATIISAGGFAGNFYDNKIEQRRINEVFKEDILNSGRRINNDKIVQCLVEKSSKEIIDLQNNGVNFIEQENRNFKLFQASGHTYKRTVRCSGGNTRQYYYTYRKIALDLGVNIVNNVNIFKLIVRDNKIYGALGVYKNKPLTVNCTSVVLATGGIAANYNFTTHRKGILGSGMYMALKAGASLVDMEFIQFMPTVVASPKKLQGCLITDTLRGEGAVLLNKNHEKFMGKYYPVKKDMETRDNVAKAIFLEIYEGLGTDNKTVYLDARNIERNRIKESFTNYNKLMEAGIDPKYNLIEISPAAHYTCGGIKIDENAFTGVEGLWAAGEVTGGLHGANRLGSVALTENIVFGKLAGENAALYSLRNKLNNKEKEAISIILDSYDCEEFRRIEEELRNIISYSAGIVRNEDDLVEGLENNNRIINLLGEKERKNAVCTYNPYLIQLQSFAFINYCTLVASIVRKESRGTHYRKDYPNESNEFLKGIVFNYNNKEIVHHFEKNL